MWMRWWRWWRNNRSTSAGKVVTKIDAKVTGRKLQAALLDAADKVTRKAKSHRNHVRSGRRGGHTWETEVPVPERRRGR